MPPIITFTSDFGTYDYYVAAVKGQILQKLPSAQLVDITHLIPNGDLAKGAFMVKNCMSDFPPKTVHIVAVDTHLGNNAHLVALHQQQFFILPDNGIIGLLSATPPDATYRLNLTEHYAAAFPAKTLYAPVAAHLASGGVPESVGTITQEYQRKRYPEPQIEQDAIRGNVIHVDGYGNLITNIDEAMVETWRDGQKIEVLFGHEKITRIRENYIQADYGDCLVLYNHARQLTIGIRQGNAAQLLGMRYNSAVVVKKI